MSDNVCHPKHYTQGGIECIEAIKAATVGKTGIEAFCVGNAIKYLFRYENKNGLEDVKKSQWYINRLIQELKEKKENYSSYSFEDDNDCEDCAHFASTESSDCEPCCYCKYTAVEGSDEFNKRSSMFKPIK